MQRQIFNSNRGLPGNIASRFGAVLAMAGLLVIMWLGRILPAMGGEIQGILEDLIRDGLGLDADHRESVPAELITDRCDAALGIIASSFLISVIYIGGDSATVSAGLPVAAVEVFQGLLLFFYLLTFTLIRYRIEFSRKVPA